MNDKVMAVTDTTFSGGKGPIRGTMSVPGDKSISHRSVIFGSIATGDTVIDGFLRGKDCLSTVACMRALGAAVEEEADGRIVIHGRGFDGLKEAGNVLDTGNSGTTIRLLTGLLAARPFYSVLTGDASIRKRPMDRIVQPLRKMGAEVWGREQGRLAPISVNGRKLHPLTYRLPVASAQVKSALMLAALQTEGRTVLTEPGPSRDHTERMIRAFGGDVITRGLTHELSGPLLLKGIHVRIPGDFSSAAFFIVAALLTPGSSLTLSDVGVNPTRTGMIDVLKQMGASIRIERPRDWNGEPVADLHIDYAPLRSAEIGGSLIPRLIDELPIIALLAAGADGTTVIRDAGELKVKETNRIRTTAEELTKIGVHIEETEDGMRIHGQANSLLRGGVADSRGDHRIGMMLAVAAQKCRAPIVVRQSEAIAVSFPSFREQLAELQR